MKIKSVSKKEVMNLEEASNFLGISEMTLRKITRDGDIPTRRVGRRYLFFRPLLEAWLRGDEEKPNYSEINRE